MKLSEEDRFDAFVEWFKAARDASHDWRVTEAPLCYDFVAGHQWDTDDIDKLKVQGRPVITFNRIGSVTDSVSGLEVSNRQEIRYIPRTVGMSGVNELLTSAAQWVRDECNAEDEESDAFVDLLVVGVGCTETRLDYDEDPEGKALILRVDPIEMYVDAAATRRNYADARHVFRRREVSVEEAEEMCPDAEVEDLHAAWAGNAAENAKSPHNATEAKFYRHDQSPDINKRTQKITMVEVQWWEHEKAHRVIDPQTKQAKVLTKEEFKRVNERSDQLRAQGMSIPPLTSAEFRQRKYKRALLGSKILKEWDGPEQGGFTYKFMTGKRDRNKKCWYGLVRAMIDPQRWANKWLSQVLHIVNSNAKGGIMAESDAFENPAEAEETWSDPSAITILNPGALRDKKIEPKPVSSYPQGIDHLMTFAISSIRDVAGVNLELLGMANKDQPGILEQQRKQAGMTILANLFDSLRHYRKDQGKLLLWYITNFLADGRLIRIGGPDQAQYVPLVHQDGLAEYDVIVDDAPSSPNQKEQTWNSLVQMMPYLSKMPLPPQIMLEFLDQSPLPASFVAKIKKIAAEAAQQQHGQDPAMVKAQADAEATKAKTETEKQRASTEEKVGEATAFKTIADGMASMAKANTAGAEADVSAVEMILDALINHKQGEHDMGLNAQQQTHDQQLAQNQQGLDQHLQVQQHQAQLTAQQQQADTQQQQADQQLAAAEQDLTQGAQMHKAKLKVASRPPAKPKK